MAAQSICIVTLSFNNLDELKTTIEHIDEQSVLPYEHIIVNGSTSPEIHDWLMTNRQPGYRKWISEPDEGISDAFNKGIRLSTGDIVHLQNSGDYYFDNHVLEKVTRAFADRPEAQWLHGKYLQFRGGQWVETGKSFDPALLYRGMRTIGHPTMFVRKEMYVKHGLFRKDKRIAMDYDFVVRIAKEPFIYLDSPLVVFTPGGLSNRKVAASLREVVDSYESTHGFSLKARLWAERTLWLSLITESAIGKGIYKMIKG